MILTAFFNSKYPIQVIVSPKCDHIVQKWKNKIIVVYNVRRTLEGIIYCFNFLIVPITFDILFET